MNRRNFITRCLACLAAVPVVDRFVPHGCDRSLKFVGREFFRSPVASDVKYHVGIFLPKMYENA